MADVVNLNAESDRNIIGDDSSPTLTLENTSSGNVLKLQNAGGTGVALSIISCATTPLLVNGAGLGVTSGGFVFNSTASAVNSLVLSNTKVQSPTVAILKLSNNSTASGPLLDLGRVDFGVVSTASACATIDFAFRVKVGDMYGWVPVYRAVA